MSSRSGGCSASQARASARQASHEAAAPGSLRPNVHLGRWAGRLGERGHPPALPLRLRRRARAATAAHASRRAGRCSGRRRGRRSCRCAARRPRHRCGSGRRSCSVDPTRPSRARAGGRRGRRRRSCCFALETPSPSLSSSPSRTPSPSLSASPASVPKRCSPRAPRPSAVGVLGSVDEAITVTVGTPMGP